MGMTTPERSRSVSSIGAAHWDSQVQGNTVLVGAGAVRVFHVEWALAQLENDSVIHQSGIDICDACW